MPKNKVVPSKQDSSINLPNLTKPGDQFKLDARITPTGKEVIKTETKIGNTTKKESAIRYPTTGTVVKIQSEKK